MKIYHVSGLLEKVDTAIIYCEVEATNERAAADHFEVDGWEWVKAPVIRLVSEATKMERAGYQPLFTLPEKI